MDLIRAILLEVEEQPAGRFWPSRPMLGRDENDVVEHIRLAAESGLVEANYRIGNVTAIMRLTSAGHDFLESSRQQSIWHKAKDMLLSQGMPMTIYSLKLALDVVVRDKLTHGR